MKTTLAALLAALLLAACGSVPAATSSAAKPAPTVTVTEPAPTVTVTAKPPRPQRAVLLNHSGSGSWNSPPFEVTGDTPMLKVVFSYSGNALGGSSDNFMADIESGSDILEIANDIAVSGGKTTTVYPDTSFGGSSMYHLSVQASGAWSFKVIQIGG